MVEQEQGSLINPSAQLDARWFKIYQPIVSFDLFTWLAHAGPFTDDEQREWDQLFGREDDEARKLMATMMATSRDRELVLALEEQREPLLHYPAIAIDAVRQCIKDLQQLAWEIYTAEQNRVVQRLYLDAIEEQLDVLLMVEATYHGDANAFAYYNYSIYPVPSPREMDVALGHLFKQLRRGLKRPETAAISTHLLEYLQQRQMLPSPESPEDNVDEDDQGAIQRGKQETSSLQEQVTFPAPTIKRFFEAVLHEYHLDHWQVLIDPAALVTRVEPQIQAILLPETPVSFDKALYLLSHELESHTLRYVAGERSSLALLGIGTKGTRLDNAIASLQSARMRVKQYRASLLKAAVEGELTKEWRAEHLTEETGAQLLAHILAERRVRWEEEQMAKMREEPKDDRWKQAYKEPKGPDVEQLPMLPEGWCWATMEQLADIIGGVTKGRDLVKRTTSTLPYLSVANVQRGFLDLNIVKTIEVPKDEIEKYLLRLGDVLLTEGGDADKLGRAAVWKGEIEKCIHQNHIFRARLVEPKVPSQWLMFYANSEQGRNYFLKAAKQTVNLASINLTQLRICPLPLPPLAEQKLIVAEVEAKLSNITHMEVTIEASLKKAEQERLSVLREAFAGRLVPQDPEDEPASVLLARIREERQKRKETEKIARSSSSGIQMEIAKRRQAGRASLYKTLVNAGRPLPPDDLFRRAGLKTDEQPESVEVFYEELVADVEDALVAETRPDYEHILLEALEPSTEMLARMAEVEATKQTQETEQGRKAADKPTLWIM